MKTLEIWFAINKNGFLGLYKDQPKRNESTGKWDSKQPFVNSLIYNEVKKLVDQSKINWEHDAEFLTITI